MISTIKKIIPTNLKRWIKEVQRTITISKVKKTHKNLLEQVKQKEKIKLAFLIVNESIWKYEHLYFLFKNNPRYEAVVFVCPFLTYGEEIMKQEVTQITKNFKQKGYQVVNTQKKNGDWYDIKKEYRPDVVLFSTPWNHTLEQYLIENFLDTLTVYVPYGFKISNLYEYHFNKNMMNYTWKFFVETNIHKNLSKKYALNKGVNTVVTGFPGMDIFLDKNFKPDFKVWKNQDKQKKKIIWAPHHTIPGCQNALSYSTFLDYAELMLDLAEDFKDDVQIAFKPHPNLRGKLNDVWGLEKTNSYFQKWKYLSNGQVEQGAYIDLFATSDAMIHDSGSFVIEYLYVKKPVMFLISSEKVKEEFNEIGVEALKNIELGYNKKDLRNFIENAVLKEKDEFKEQREDFFEELVKPPNDKMASENIYEYLIQTFEK